MSQMSNKPSVKDEQDINLGRIIGELIDHKKTNNRDHIFIYLNSTCLCCVCNANLSSGCFNSS